MSPVNDDDPPITNPGCSNHLCVCVLSYYKGIRQMVPVSDQDMNTHLAEVSRVRKFAAISSLPDLRNLLSSNKCQEATRIA